MGANYSEMRFNVTARFGKAVKACCEGVLTFAAWILFALAAF